MSTGNVQIVVNVKVPAWARDESAAVQELILAQRLNKGQVTELREFAANYAGVGQPRLIGYSRARSFVNRDLGDISDRGERLGAMSRAHPKAWLRLNVAGQKLAVALAEGMRDADETPAAGGE